MLRLIKYNSYPFIITDTNETISRISMIPSEFKSAAHDCKGVGKTVSIIIPIDCTISKISTIPSELTSPETQISGP